MLAEPEAQAAPFASWVAMMNHGSHESHFACRVIDGNLEAVHDARCGRFVTAVLTCEGSLYAWGSWAARRGGLLCS